jgi:transposase
LTAEQWVLIEPLLSTAPSWSGAYPQNTLLPSRPPPDLRLVLDAILWKISHQEPWYSLPGPARLRAAPGWQSCYRYYRKWQRSGLLDQIYHTLYQDLVQRGGLDLPAALSAGGISFDRCFGHWVLNFDPAWQDTWQLETARLFLALAARRLPRPKRQRTLSL